MMKYVWILFLVLLLALSTAAQDYLNKVWEFDTRTSIVDVYVLNIDDTPYKEVFAGSKSSGVVYAISSSGEKLWEFRVKGRLLAMHASDVADNTGEMVVGTWSRGVSLKGDGSKRWQYYVTRYDIESAYVDDLDGDGMAETVLGVLGGWRGNSLVILNSLGGKICSIGLSKSAYPYSLHSVDLDSDGKKEIIVGQAVYTMNTATESYSIGFNRASHVAAYDMQCNEIWKIVTDGGVKAITSGDLFADGQDEIVLGVNKKVAVISGVGKILWDYKVADEVNAVVVRDLDGDGNAEVIVGADSLYVLNASGDLVWKSGKLSAVNTVVAEDLDFDGKAEIIIGSSKIYIFGSDGSILYTSDSFKAVNSIKVTDVDLDGYFEVIAGSNDARVRLFETKSFVKETMATSYYERATRLYNSAKYENVSLWALKAKKIYEEIGDSSGSTNSGLLNEKSLDHMKADNYTAIAKAFYDIEEFENASEYAQMARTLYSKIGDTMSMNEIKRLATASDAKPSADANMSLALEYYRMRDFDNALTYARIASGIYNLIGDENLTNQSNQLLSDIEQQNVAGKNFDEALFYYGEKAYENAREYLDIADAIYDEIGDTGGKELVAGLRAKMNRSDTLRIVLVYGSIVLGIILLLTIVGAVFMVGITLGGGKPPAVVKNIVGKITSLNLRQRLTKFKRVKKDDEVSSKPRTRRTLQGLKE